MCVIYTKQTVIHCASQLQNVIANPRQHLRPIGGDGFGIGFAQLCSHKVQLHGVSVHDSAGDDGGLTHKQHTHTHTHTHLIKLRDYTTVVAVAAHVVA